MESDKRETMDVSRTTDSLTTAILDLNDYCLDKVLSYLSCQDILSVAQVCVRLEDRCRYIFTRKNYTLNVYCEEAKGSRFLRVFGPGLTKLQLFFCDDLARNQENIDLVTEFCIDNLKEIRLNGLTDGNKLRKPFNGVEKLTLSFCDSIGDLTKWFPNLTCLLHYRCTEISKERIPTMYSLSVTHTTVLLTVQDLWPILEANPQTKHLSLNFTDRASRLSSGGDLLSQLNQHSLILTINQLLPELQTFSICDHGLYVESLYHTLHFKHLKSLKIESYSYSCPNYLLLNRLVVVPSSLERLQLRFSDFIDTRDCSYILKYKNLRELQLMLGQNALKVDQILMLVDNLPLLKRIQLVDFNVMSWTTVEITKLLSNSKQLKELLLIFVNDNLQFKRQLVLYQAARCIEWTIRSEYRHAAKIFETNGLDGEIEKNFLIRITKNIST